jgi:hypothetical protein
MTQWAAMVMRKIYVNAWRPQSKRNRVEPFDCRSARRWLAAGCSRLAPQGERDARGHQCDSRRLGDRRVSQDARDGMGIALSGPCVARAGPLMCG